MNAAPHGSAYVLHDKVGVLRKDCQAVSMCNGSLARAERSPVAVVFSDGIVRDYDIVMHAGL
jgi:hypothetical protein